MMKKIAVVLSGCGFYDGAEIHESVCSMIAIEKHGASYSLFAPDVNQLHVVDHLTGKEMGESRNVLVEAARIARGNIQPLSELKESDFDALMFPGGFGAAKNLSSFATEGKKMDVLPEVSSAILAFQHADKPIAALCISPVLLAQVLKNVKVTIGTDESTISAIEYFGASHYKTTNKEIVIDAENKVVSGPCYMLDSKISEIFENSNLVVEALLDLIED